MSGVAWKLDGPLHLLACTVQSYRLYLVYDVMHLGTLEHEVCMFLVQGSYVPWVFNDIDFGVK